jgi:hypothetical protein
MPAADAGEQGPCPQCGTIVTKHSLIPVLDDETARTHRYLCVTCARQAAGLPAEPVQL